MDAEADYLVRVVDFIGDEVIRAVETQGHGEEYDEAACRSLSWCGA